MPKRLAIAALLAASFLASPARAQDCTPLPDGGGELVDGGPLIDPAQQLQPDPELSGSGGCASVPGASLAALLLAVVLLTRRRSGALVLALLLFGATARAASVAPGFALDRFEPAERGSRWFTADDLTLQGELHPTL